MVILVAFWMLLRHFFKKLNKCSTSQEFVPEICQLGQVIEIFALKNARNFFSSQLKLLASLVLLPFVVILPSVEGALFNT